MDQKEKEMFQDAVTQIYSYCTVTKEYSDNHFQEPEVFHMGLMIDKIFEQSEILKAMIEV